MNRYIKHEDFYYDFDDIRKEVDKVLNRYKTKELTIEELEEGFKNAIDIGEKISKECEEELKWAEIEEERLNEEVEDLLEEIISLKEVVEDLESDLEGELGI